MGVPGGGFSTMTSSPPACHVKAFRDVNVHLRVSQGWLRSGGQGLALQSTLSCSRISVFSGCAVFLLPNRRLMLFWR